MKDVFWFGVGLLIDTLLIWWIVSIAGMENSIRLIIAVIIFGLVQYTEGALGVYWRKK